MAPIRTFTGWFIRKTLRLIFAAVLGLVLGIFLTSTAFAEDKWYVIESADFGPYTDWSVPLHGGTVIDNVVKPMVEDLPSPFSTSGPLLLNGTYDPSCVAKADLLPLLNDMFPMIDANSYSTRVRLLSVSAGANIENYTANFNSCTGTGSTSSKRKTQAKTCSTAGSLYESGTYSLPFSLQLTEHSDNKCGNYDVVCYAVDGSEVSCSENIETIHLAAIQGAASFLVGMNAMMDNASPGWHTTISQCNDAHYNRSESSAGTITYCSGSCPTGFERDLDANGWPICGEQEEEEEEEEEGEVVTPTAAGTNVTFPPVEASWTRSEFTVTQSFRDTAVEIDVCLYSTGTVLFLCKTSDGTDYSRTPSSNCGTYGIHKQLTVGNGVCSRDVLTSSKIEVENYFTNYVEEDVPVPDDEGSGYDVTCAQGCDSYLTPSLLSGTVFQKYGQTSKGFHTPDYLAAATPFPDTAWAALPDGTFTSDIDVVEEKLTADAMSGLNGTYENTDCSPLKSHPDDHSLTFSVSCFTYDLGKPAVKDNYNSGDVVVKETGTSKQKKSTQYAPLVTHCPTVELCSGYSHGREPVPYTTGGNGNGNGDSGDGDDDSDGDCEPYGGDLDDDGVVIESTVVICDGEGDGGDCEPYSGDLDDDGEVIESTVVTCDGDGDGECVPVDSEGLSLYGTTEDLPACSDVGEGNLPTIDFAQTCLDDNGYETTEGCAVDNQEVVDRMEAVQESLSELVIEKLGLDGLSFTAECPKWEADVPYFEESVVLEINCDWLEYIGLFMVLSSTAAAVRMVLV